MCLPAAAANLGSVDAWAQLGTAQISLGRARCDQGYLSGVRRFCSLRNKMNCHVSV